MVLETNWSGSWFAMTVLTIIISWCVIGILEIPAHDHSHLTLTFDLTQIYTFDSYFDHGFHSKYVRIWHLIVLCKESPELNPPVNHQNTAKYNACFKNLRYTSYEFKG